MLSVGCVYLSILNATDKGPTYLSYDSDNDLVVVDRSFIDGKAGMHEFRGRCERTIALFLFAKPKPAYA
ncbi:hypothetical protein CES85_3047 (plasmid) [Ochrobactrum quorumnocens]|uniref:Uncharacterized protein n=1 Tax=Ochrobactrum quorumnocens TaxID=271865 RepID=A0A248UM65_9HYPH|nr:hypothetical protein CES85_3047 [[Ochrobactrum] quorumnocens]